MDYKEISARLCNFYEKEVMSNMEGLNKYIGYVGMFLANKQVESIFSNLKDNPAIKMFDIIHDNDVNLDKLYESFMFAIDKTETVELLGVKLNRKGIETLFKYLRG